MVTLSHDLNKTRLDHNAILVSKNEICNTTIRMKYMRRKMTCVGRGAVRVKIWGCGGKRAMKMYRCQRSDNSSEVAFKAGRIALQGKGRFFLFAILTLRHSGTSDSQDSGIVQMASFKWNFVLPSPSKQQQQKNTTTTTNNNKKQQQRSKQEKQNKIPLLNAVFIFFV